jgi:predicted RNase H-like HicB family nuclease
MPMRFKIEFEREADGRWLAEVMELPGVLAYGGTKDDALKAVEVLALRVLADRLEHGEPAPQPFQVSFEAA